MTDPAQPPQSPVSTFPSPPVPNLQVPAPAQPALDAVLAQSLIADDLPASPTAVSPPTSPSSAISAPSKESLPPRLATEAAPIVEIHETEPLPVEVEGWLQKLEAAGDIKLPEPITHDGDVLLADSEAQIVKEKLVLPMSQAAVQQGLSAKISDSARWLAEWCTRLLKGMKNEVKYAPETAKNTSTTITTQTTSTT